MMSLNVRPIKKRLLVTEKSPGQDFISNLPDGIISDILSRLPTKDAVKTSVLSSNWKCKWASIYDITIDDMDEYFDGTDGIARFNCAVTRLLLRSRNSRLRSCVLECDRKGHRLSDFETWTSEILMRSVQFLKIIASDIEGLNSPWCFSGWTSLTSLVLEISCTLKVPTNNCFPNLKSLVLADGHHGNIKIMTANTGRVILVFPVLEKLQFRNCEWLNVDFVEIQAPELITFSNDSSREFKNYKMKISGPKLAVFKVGGHVPANDFVLNAPAVAYLTVRHLSSNGTSALEAHKLLKNFANLKCFRVSGRSLRALLRLKLEFVSPTFLRLKELEVNFRCDIKYVFDLLRMLPPLESLIISVKTLELDDYEVGEALTPKIVSQLKKVILLNLSLTKGECDLLKYLLENAMNLQEMTVYYKKPATIDGRTVTPAVVRAKAIGKSLSKKKDRLSCCIAFVEQDCEISEWSMPWPKVVLNESYTTQLVFE